MRTPNWRQITWNRLVLLLAVTALGMPQSASADQVILDDLIVDGSIAVGFDSVNGESFGFDTLRLKENNLRIHFQDTSTTASFPTNDWRIVINDTSNGGGNYFGIEDSDRGRIPFRVEAGAPAHSLYVDDGGRVGFGTSTPVVDLHVVSGNTPTLRLAQDGSSGFTAQTWDVAGNEANFFIRDATNGSTLPFRIYPDAGTNSLAIAADDDVGIGTNSPSANINPSGTVQEASLHIRRTNRPATLFVEAAGNSAGAAVLRAESTNTSTQQARLDLVNNLLEYRFINNGNRVQWFDVTGNKEVLTLRGQKVGVLDNDPQFPLQVGTDATNGNGAHVTIAGVWTNASTRASKERITDLDGELALETIDRLQPVTYFAKGSGEDGEQYVGFIADDVPELVAMNDRSGIAAIEIAALVTKVVQEQRTTIESQKETIENLVKRVESLESAQAAD